MVAYLLWCLVAIFKISFFNFIFSKFYYTKSSCVIQSDYCVNTLRPRQNGRHFTDDTLKRIFMNENARISINISLKFVPTGLINNIPALVQIMAWRRPGDNPLSEPMMFNLLTHICVTRPQWVKKYFIFICLTWFVSVGFHHNVRLSTFLLRGVYGSVSIDYMWKLHQNQLVKKFLSPGGEENQLVHTQTLQERMLEVQPGWPGGSHNVPMLGSGRLANWLKTKSQKWLKVIHTILLNIYWKITLKSKLILQLQVQVIFLNISQPSIYIFECHYHQFYACVWLMRHCQFWIYSNLFKIV